MNARERVYRVLNHEIPDCCPVLFRAMDQNLQYTYADIYDIEEQDECFYWRDLSPLISMKVDAFDFTLPTIKPNVKVERNGLVDSFGRIMRNGAYSDGHFKNREIFEQWQLDHPYTLVDSNDPKNFKKMLDLAGDRIAIFACLRGLFEATWESIGLGRFGRFMRKDPDFISDVVQALFDYTYSNAKLLLEEGVEFISVADDFGFKNGPITRESFYHDTIFPRYKKLNDLVHKHGGKIYLHSEGNIKTLMPGIIDCGFDAVQGLTPIDGIDIGEIKELYGDKIALFGGLSHSELFDNFTPEDVRQSVNKVFDAAGANGGLMIGPSAMVDEHCNLDNVLALIKSIHACKY